MTEDKGPDFESGKEDFSLEEEEKKIKRPSLLKNILPFPIAALIPLSVLWFGTGLRFHGDRAIADRVYAV